MIRLSQRLLLLLLLVASTSGCAPSIKDLGLDQEIIDNISKEQALSFLQSLAATFIPEAYCNFEADGVRRWYRNGVPFKYSEREQMQKDKYPYNVLSVQPVMMGMVGLSGPGRLNSWCFIDARYNATKQGKEFERFTGKIIMALMSLGVRAGDYGRSGLHPRE